MISLRYLFNRLIGGFLSPDQRARIGVCDWRFVSDQDGHRCHTCGAGVIVGQGDTPARCLQLPRKAQAAWLSPDDPALKARLPVSQPVAAAEKPPTSPVFVR